MENNQTKTFRNKLNIAGIPDELKQLNQWVCWKTEFRDNKFTKIPICARTGNKAKSNDKNTWTNFVVALKRFELDESIAGLGFMFSKDTKIMGMDIDHCITEGIIQEKALNVIKLLNTYTEYSISGNGVHCIFKASLPENAKNRKDNFEFYDDYRFFVITGDAIKDVHN